MVSGNRFLAKNQTSALQNGSYVWNGAAVAATRTTDADTSAEVVAGIVYLVTEGTTHADSSWVLSTNNPITLDTTALSFTSMGGGGSTYTGTANRIGISGTQIDIAATYVGQTSLTTVGTVTTGAWNATSVGVAFGGTGAGSASGAKANLGFMTRYSQTYGDGVATSFTITHNLNTLDVIVGVYNPSGGLERICDVTHTDVNTITLSGYTQAPSTNSRRVVVIG
jgi:hypothetical protein